MTTIDELQAVVSSLSAEELERFSRWFEEYLADAWDRKIEADVLEGRLDKAGQQAVEDYQAGRCTPLP